MIVQTLINSLLLIMPLLLLSACEKQTEGNLQDKDNQQQATSIDADLADINSAQIEKVAVVYETVEWTELMPKDDLDALMNPPSYITDIEDGSLEDQISSQLISAQSSKTSDRYQQALASTKVIESMNGKPIRIAGFIVPLEYDDEQIVTEFFLVPFFGACIHVPPPPPNQIIYVKYPKGIKLEVLYDPFWITGILNTTQIANDMATAAYTLEMHSYEVYYE